MARTKGALNRNKQRLMNALRAEYGDDFDPIMKMAKNSHVMQAKVDALIEADKEAEVIAAIPEVNKEWSRIAEFVTPKLKAVEMVVDMSMQVSDLSDHALEERIKELRDASES